MEILDVTRKLWREVDVMCCDFVSSFWNMLRSIGSISSFFHMKIKMIGPAMQFRNELNVEVVVTWEICEKYI